MREGFVSCYIKYAKSEREALSYIVKGKKETGGHVTFKKGGSGRIISIEKE